MEQHQQNIELYLNSGGDTKLAKRYQLPTLENRAKISYLLSKISNANNITQNANNFAQNANNIAQNVDSSNSPKTSPVASKTKFLGLISQYPVALHPSYNEAFSLWLKLCSLKIRLNAVSPADESAAYEIQTEMLGKIRRFDQCKKALEHYNQYKEIIPTKSKRDFSKLTELELDRERRNLASNICKRKQTVAKKENELPEKDSPLYQRRLEALNKKRRELEELILDEEKILEMIGT